MPIERPDYAIHPMYVILPPGGNELKAKVTVTVTVIGFNGERGSQVYEIPTGSTEVFLNDILPGV